MWVGSSLWLLDLLANLLSIAVLVGFLGLIVFALTRRWAEASIGAAVVIAGLLALTPAGATRSRTAAGAISFLHLNARADNPKVEGLREFLVRTNAEVVTLVDLPNPLAAEIRSNGLDGRFEHRSWSSPNDTYSQWVVVMSRWPLRPWNRAGSDDKSGMHAVVVERPEGGFGVIAVHASSPRSRARWVVGNQTIDRVAATAQEMRRSGLPVVVIGDLNGTISGRRVRQLSRIGLGRVMPSGWGGGTYPSVAPALFRVGIDGAMVSADWEVWGWQTRRHAGSDHLSIQVELGLSGSD